MNAAVSSLPAMPSATLGTSVQPLNHGRLFEHEPLARRTSWRVGGPAKRLYEPASRQDLVAFVAGLPADEEILWLGLGSNLLVRDGGFTGTVIALHKALDAITLDAENQRLTAAAGAHCARVAKTVERQGFGGLGFMAGIPGTVGGALAMNAGAWGGETWPAVDAAEVLFRDGRTAWIDGDAVAYGYRSVELPPSFAGFLAARFRLEPDADGAIATRTRASLEQRKATQPVGQPSAGSTFRNPPGDHAARLIQAAGLKGFAIGGASVSEKHANFLITAPGATAADVEALIAHVRAVVAERFGVDLHPEVRVVGDPA